MPSLIRQSISPTDINKVEKVIVDKIQLGSPDETGRKRPEIIKGADYEIKSDLVIKSLGFDPENLPQLFDSPDLLVTK